MNYIEELVEGLDPNHPSTIALKEAALTRPVPAIEKPLGLRTQTFIETSKPIVLIDNMEGFAGWKDIMRGREWG